MHISDRTHDYDCATCRHTGGVCLEALWLCQRIASSLEARCGSLPETFFLRSQTVFQGCGRDCAAELSLGDERIEIACGLDGPDGNGDATRAAARVQACKRDPQQLPAESAAG